MSKPKYLYKMSDKLVAHADSGGCLVIQQANLINDMSPDNCLFIGRDDLAKLRDAIDEFLTATTVAA